MHMVPVVMHNILIVHPADTKALIAGVKNMHSSSGCAMTSNATFPFPSFRSQFTIFREWSFRKFFAFDSADWIVHKKATSITANFHHIYQQMSQGTHLVEMRRRFFSVVPLKQPFLAEHRIDASVRSMIKNLPERQIGSEVLLSGWLQNVR